MIKPESNDTDRKNTRPVTVDVAALRLAEQLIVSCEACTPDLAEISFEHVLDCITGCDPESTDYVLKEPARCPNCGAEVLTGYWRWYKPEAGGRKVFILPGTLVALKRQ
jgi:hypothetical protein